MTHQQASPSRGWIVTLAALSVNLILGLLYAWGVIGKALVAQWNWTKTQASLPFTVATVAFALMMVFAGRVQDRVGPRFVAAAGGFILGTALIVSSFVTSPMAMVFTFGVLGGLGIGLGYSATTPPCIKWFPPEKKGLITGIVVSGVGIAAVYISPITEYLIGKVGIPRTFVILGTAAIICVGILSQFLVNPPAGYKPVSTKASAVPVGGVAARAPGRRDMDWNEMLKTGQFYILWSMFVLGAAAGLMLIMHVAIIAKEQAGLKWGFMPVATLAVFNTVGRVLSGYASDTIGRKKTIILAFLLQAVNMFVFMHYTTPTLVIFGSAFTGLCYGALFTLMPSATADSYGLKNLGVNYGLVFTSFGVAGVLGPIVAGRIRDLSGSYQNAYISSAVLLLIGAGLAFTLRNPNVVHTTEAAAAQNKPGEPLK